MKHQQASDGARAGRTAGSTLATLQTFDRLSLTENHGLANGEKNAVSQDDDRFYEDIYFGGKIYVV